MRDFLLRLLINAIALAAIAAILPGIHISDNELTTLLIVSFIFGVINAVIKPILIVLSCPLVILSLGLFMLVINGGLLLITDKIAGSRFEIDTLGWAILGGIIMGIIGSILENALDVDDDDKKDKDDGVIIIRS
ncbi:MAG: phage holin family protein [Anaerolineae bacterium]|nr:phage holin family protein [Anaerolineae bacterium]